MKDIQTENGPGKELTINELSALMGEEYGVVSAFVKVLIKIGAAKEVGKESRPAGQRGKPSVIYAIDRDIDLSLWDDAKVIEEITGEPAPVVEPVVSGTAVA